MSAACNIEEIINELQKASNTPDNKKVAKALLDYLEAKRTIRDASLWHFGLPVKREFLEALSSIRQMNEWEDAVCEKAKEYVNESKDDIYLREEAQRKGVSSHKIRKDKIEDAITLLKRLSEERVADKKVLKPEILTLLAEAYLLRSTIILPRGITIPEKKKEAIDKGLECTEEAIKNGGDKNAYRCNAMLYMEKERILERDERTPELREKIQKALEEALKNGCTEFNDIEKDVKIAVLYSELSGDKTSYVDRIISSNLSDIELERARAHKIKGNSEKVDREALKLIKRLYRTPFSAPIWDDTVRFFKELKECNVDCWGKLSLRLWSVCNAIENRTRSLHIRWYWSRLRELYDLAFLAAGNNCKLKAKIADSLKSRPALKWNVIEEYAKMLPEGNEKKELIKEVLDAHETALASGYVKKMPKEPPPKSKDKQIPINNVPEGLIVIHFYINQLEKQGYALIYDNTDKNKPENDKWKQEVFKYDELFNAYMEWHTNYNLLTLTMHTEKRNHITPEEKGKVSEYLKILCEKIGESMPFLFKFQQENKPVLFIPHDFLHRLPLQGAISKEENKVFLEKHQSCYLPAWSLALGGKPAITKGNYLLKKFDDDYEELIEKIEWHNVISPNDPPDNLESIEGLSAPPGFLVVLCHGKANAINPFMAKLLLKDNPTLLRITTMDIDLAGSKVFLGACETDLVPPLLDVVDEHLSISTSLLGKGASEIIGTLWVVDPWTIEDIIINHCFKHGTQREAIWSYQKETVESELFNTLAFRVIGYQSYALKLKL